MKQETFSHPIRQQSIGLFIDGENLSHDLADQIVAIANDIGRRGIRRVYGDATRMQGWRAQGTLQVVDSAQGKNAADMLLAIEAMEAALVGRVTIIAIASCDRDFSHLARKLSDHDVHVVGIGPAEPDCAFRKACSDYREVAKPGRMSIATTAPVPSQDKIEKWIETVIGQAKGKCLSLSALGQAMMQQHRVTKADLPCPSWKSFLSGRPRFSIDQSNVVRLAKNLSSAKAEG